MSTDSDTKTWEDAVQSLRNSPDKRDLVLAAYYDDPLIEAAERYWKSEEWASIKRHLPMSGSALDIGAGRGIASYALAKQGFSVTALEPDPSPIVGSQAISALAAEAGLSIETTEEFSERLPYPDQSFDILFARAVLHHTSDLKAACKEFYRVLKPNGIFIAAREHVISKKEDLQSFLASHPLHSLYGGENAFLLKEYKDAIEGASLQLDHTLAPLRSPINFAPHNLPSLKEEVAHTVSQKTLVPTFLMRSLLRIPGIWLIIRPLAELADNRPGRLYSFIAHRPSK